MATKKRVKTNPKNYPKYSKG